MKLSGYAARVFSVCWSSSKSISLVVGSSATYPGTGAVTPGSAALLAGNGDGTFAASRAVKLGPLQGANDVRIVDADKDGKQDLVVASVYDGSFSVLYGRGGGSFVEKAQLPAQATALAHADLNGDSKVDVVAVSVSTNKLYVMLGNGDGTTAAARAYDTDRGPSAVTIADVNENYGSDYTGCSFNTCRRLNHVPADRSAV